MEVVVVVEVEVGVVAVAARHLQQEGGPFHLMAPVGADEGARALCGLVAAFRRRISRARLSESIGRFAMSTMNDAALYSLRTRRRSASALEAEEGDDGDRVAAPPFLDQPDPHLVRDVGRQPQVRP